MVQYLQQFFHKRQHNKRKLHYYAYLTGRIIKRRTIKRGTFLMVSLQSGLVQEVKSKILRHEIWYLISGTQTVVWIEELLLVCYTLMPALKTQCLCLSYTIWVKTWQVTDCNQVVNWQKINFLLSVKWHSFKINWNWTILHNFNLSQIRTIIQNQTTCIQIFFVIFVPDIELLVVCFALKLVLVWGSDEIWSIFI